MADCCIVFCTKHFFVLDQGNLASAQSPLCSFLSLCSVCHHRYDHYPPQPLVVEIRSCCAQAITLVERRLLLRFTQHHHRSPNYIFHTTIWLDPDKTINCKNLPYIHPTLAKIHPDRNNHGSVSPPRSDSPRTPRQPLLCRLHLGQHRRLVSS